MPPPKLELPGFEKSGSENESHMDLGGGASIYIYIYIRIYACIYTALNMAPTIDCYRVGRRQGTQPP